MPDLLFTPASAFSAPMPEVSGLAVNECTDISLATVMLTPGAGKISAARVMSEFGFSVPSGPARATRDDLSLIGFGPGVWLAVSENHAPGAFAAHLSEVFAGAATVSDQSSGYAVLRMSGPRAHTILQAALPVDLDPSVFPPAAVAVTVLAHIGVIVWRSEPDVWNIACFRSMADSLAHWLATAG